MKIGKVPQTVIKRVVLKNVKENMEENLLCVQVTKYGNDKELCTYVVYEAANELLSRGIAPSCMQLTILLPPYAYESRLKAMSEAAAEAAKTCHIKISEIHAEVMPHISAGIVTASMQGKELEEISGLRSPNDDAGNDIVLAGTVGLEGSIRILKEKEEELRERFIPAFLDGFARKQKELYREELWEILKGISDVNVTQITDGGILAALWKITKECEWGMDVDLKKMSICQETVEICEHFRLNPYQLASSGSFLILTKDGEGLQAKLKEAGIRASVIGQRKAGCDKIIRNGEEMRYLDRPAPDEFLKLFWREGE
ncbi:MAG: hypothetical protein K2O96_05520 [Lachnospiraceae bacterium]|nr:hypothetical protein [Lachnospiraceae bacterium]